LALDLVASFALDLVASFALDRAASFALDRAASFALDRAASLALALGASFPLAVVESGLPDEEKLSIRISGTSLPVAALIFAFCSSVNGTRTSFAICCLLLRNPIRQERGQLLRPANPLIPLIEARKQERGETDSLPYRLNN
jgi:hypothetical protein